MLAAVACARLAWGCSSRAEAGDGAPAEEPPQALPDPLVFADGRRVASVEDWRARRGEILDLFREHVYGRAPGRPERSEAAVVEEDVNAMGGSATMRRVAIKSFQAGREHSFELLRFAPNARPRAGAFLLLSNRPARHTDPKRATPSAFWPAEAIVARGYVAAVILNDELAPDDSATYGNGVIRLFEGDLAPARPPNAWKAISAWSWGASRAMDYLETDPSVDAAKVAVIGHSRGGKAALWAGAQDERFSFVVSNESGCAGAAISRRPVGETVAGINLVFPHWFAENFRRYDRAESTLPIDQHELIALLAPRAVAVGSAANDEWSDPEGEFLGLALASPVYALWGFPLIDPASVPRVDAPLFTVPRSYHLRPGDHDLLEADWNRYLDVADMLWRVP